jgi:hypothetical protein
MRTMVTVSAPSHGIRSGVAPVASSMVARSIHDATHRAPSTVRAWRYAFAGAAGSRDPVILWPGHLLPLAFDDRGEERTT